MSDTPSITGSLEFLTLADLLQLFGANGNSGILKLKSPYADLPGMVYLSEGNPFDAADGYKTGLDAIFALFGWTEGVFEFYTETVSMNRVIRKSRMEIILDGLRMLDDGEIPKLGPKSALEMAVGRDGKRNLPVIRGPLLDYMYVVDEEDFEESEVIAEEGRHGSWIWVILGGTVEISKTMNDEVIPLVRVGDGAFIGSVASFVMSDNVRSATATAVGSVQLGVLDAQRLTAEYSRMPRDLKDVVISVDNRLKQITQYAADRYFNVDNVTPAIEGKEPFIRQGDDFEELHIIRSGQAAVVRKTDYGDVLLAVLEEGDYVGHVRFLDIGHEPYSASVFVTPDFRSEPIDQQALKDTFKSLSTTMRNIIEHTAVCVSITTSVECSFRPDDGSASGAGDAEDAAAAPKEHLTGETS